MKPCYICGVSKDDKDILFKGMLDITYEEFYICYDCAAKFSIKPYGLSINISDDNGKPFYFGGTVRHWIVPKEFSNENR